MKIKSLRGLKYPDEYVIRYFFKSGYTERPGKVLEFGCGNGNNLQLFAEYDWEVVGVDIDAQAIDDARANFSKRDNAQFFQDDMIEFIRSHKTWNYDVILFPACLCCVSHSYVKELFKTIWEHQVLRSESSLFIRTRSVRDYRFARGEKIDERTFRITATETGEQGNIVSFILESELCGLLQQYYDFSEKWLLHCDFDNVQGGQLTSNSDIIFWGQVNQRLAARNETMA